MYVLFRSYTAIGYSINSGFVSKNIIWLRWYESYDYDSYLWNYFRPYKEKYDQISVRQYLLSEPDARFCPRPDCKFALIATEFASCPKIQCQECQTDFCYHCRQVWHPNQPCDQLRFTQECSWMVLLQSLSHRQGEYFMNTIKFLQFRPPPGFPRIPHLTSMANSTPDIKPCPRND